MNPTELKEVNANATCDWPNWLFALHNFLCKYLIFTFFYRKFFQDKMKKDNYVFNYSKIKTKRYCHNSQFKDIERRINYEFYLKLLKIKGYKDCQKTT